MESEKWDCVRDKHENSVPWGMMMGWNWRVKRRQGLVNKSGLIEDS